MPSPLVGQEWRRYRVLAGETAEVASVFKRLLGRSAECEFLDAAVADALDGRSRIVVIRGEAGIGKSALLDHVADRLDGWWVARAVGVEAEVELAYSGLHQLCSPMLTELERLPEPQREALATVFDDRNGREDRGEHNGEHQRSGIIPCQVVGAIADQ